jgi:hypothetical protein
LMADPILRFLFKVTIFLFIAALTLIVGFRDMSQRI